ncbi:alcohol dehydrogenase catalytic domain-containing protein [Candidatus Binatia bacterium]|nr:alcohol dehydrogenase catalytic domain-containing protein [Candidatus Binatia bacterium]
MKTRAAVAFAAGEPMRLVEIDLAPPGPREALVRVGAVGVCRSDLHAWQDAAGQFPIVLGHEVAGHVESVGPEVDHVVAGDAVVLTWLPYCGSCPTCRRNLPQLCPSVFRSLFAGTLLDGTSRISFGGQSVYHYSLLSGFAAHTVVPARACVPLPAGLPVAEACILGCGVATGYGAAVRAGRVQRGESVAVLGVGGVGLAAIQGAGACGAGRVLAVDVQSGNLELARKLGATETRLAGETGAADAGFDVVIDTTGKVAAARAGFEMLSPGGRLIVIGAFDSDELRLPARGFHRTGKTVKASFYGDIDPIDGLRELAEQAAAGRLALAPLISARRRLDDVNEIFGAMQAETAGPGRTVIVLDG